IPGHDYTKSLHCKGHSVVVCWNQCVYGNFFKPRRGQCKHSTNTVYAAKMRVCMTRKMLLIFVVLSLVGGNTYLSAQHKVEPRNVRLVRRFILTRSLGMVSGMDHKQNVRLGDKAAQALVIILGDDFSTDPKDVGIYLAIIKTAFLDPESISDPSDRIPK